MMEAFMSSRSRSRSFTRRSVVLPAVTAGAAALVLAACGSSSSKAASTAPPSSAPASTAAPAAAGSTTAPAAAGSTSSPMTISTASVPGVGTVLVNGSGRTLYLLTSEKGGKVTCTDANGCTKYWPDSELPAGVTKATAGMGVQASLLGTTKTADGSLYVTYASYPLYTFVGDSAAGTDHGQGITNFGGTWWVISPSGVPVTTMAHASSSTTPSTSSSGGGYGGGY
jgi:predicted lipoprotein with Yx(FWY)xxD motif